MSASNKSNNRSHRTNKRSRCAKWESASSIQSTEDIALEEDLQLMRRSVYLASSPQVNQLLEAKVPVPIVARPQSEPVLANVSAAQQANKILPLDDELYHQILTVAREAIATFGYNDQSCGPLHTQETLLRDRRQRAVAFLEASFPVLTTKSVHGASSAKDIIDFVCQATPAAGQSMVVKQETSEPRRPRTATLPFKQTKMNVSVVSK